MCKDLYCHYWSNNTILCEITCTCEIISYTCSALICTYNNRSFSQDVTIRKIITWIIYLQVAGFVSISLYGGSVWVMLWMFIFFTFSILDYYPENTNKPFIGWFLQKVQTQSLLLSKHCCFCLIIRPAQYSNTNSTNRVSVLSVWPKQW